VWEYISKHRDHDDERSNDLIEYPRKTERQNDKTLFDLNLERGL
jgi:hypothetical protein